MEDAKYSYLPLLYLFKWNKKYTDSGSDTGEEAAKLISDASKQHNYLYFILLAILIAVWLLDEHSD